MQDKKLGIIGLGAIGVKVANVAKYMGMEVYGYDPYVSVDAAWNLSRDVKHVLNVEDIYEQCDIITIHVPLLDSTKGMIDSQAIDRMKDGVILINNARGQLINEQDVADALNSGKMAAAGLDVRLPSPSGRTTPCSRPKTASSTPHISWAPGEPPADHGLHRRKRQGLSGGRAPSTW